MSKKDDGGLSFPVSVTMPDGSVAVEKGMSLRDYFAAKAMQGYVGVCHYKMDVLSAMAYAQADAMLAERAK